MEENKLIILCGLPGSGKTTLAKKFEDDGCGIRFSPDDWMDHLGIDLYNEDMRNRIESLQWNIAKNLLSTKGCVIIEWGTWGRAEREILRLEAKEINAKTELHYLAVPAEELYRRIKDRDMEDPPITEKIVKGWFKVFQAPDSDELNLYDRHVVHKFS